MGKDEGKGGGERNPEVDGLAVCALVSGGMDSSVLVSQLSRDYRKVYPLYIRTGLLWEETELYWLKRFLRRIARPNVAPLSVLDLPMGDTCGSHWGFSGEGIPDGASPDESVYLPGRNILLISKAAVFCTLNRIGVIAIGILKGNPFPDSSPLFLQQFAQVLSMGLGSSVQVVAPFSTLSKDEVIQRGEGLPLELTFSCIAPMGRYHCGDCNKCAERKKAFALLNKRDQTRYASRVGGSSWVKG